MRIFVTGTGRCGTVTFSKAASHATNYTVGHETHAGRVGDWEYPDNHIEVSAQLVIAIPLLQEKYPDAMWVHLNRTNRYACVQSLAKMREVMDAFSFVFFQKRDPDPVLAAQAIYDTLTHLCRNSLRRVGFEFKLEAAQFWWPYCWRWMRCEGDLEASVKEWDTKYNASEV